MELSKSYSEINTILDILGDDYKEKLPNKMVTMLDRASDKSYVPNISKDDFMEGNYSGETKTILSILYINYWTNTEDKEKYMSELKEKDQQFIIPKSKVVIRDIFATPEIKEEHIEEAKVPEEKSLVPVNEGGIIGKIKAIISKIFKK